MRYALYKCQRCDTLFDIETECDLAEMEAEKVHSCIGGKSIQNFGIAKLVGYAEVNDE